MMPWAVEQTVLVAAIPVAVKLTQCRLKPFTVMADVVTLSPAKLAASVRSLRNATQCCGV